MNTAEMIEVTDRDYKPSREEILSYPSRTFSEDIGEYILKFKENDDLQKELRETYEWDRMMVSNDWISPKRDWQQTVTHGDCMKERIYRLGCIVYKNFLESTHE